MSETQKLTFKDLICSKLEGNGIQAVPSGNYIVVGCESGILRK